ncbi:MAG: S8 family serine peptidase [Phycisphaerae bacterium]|nr:S8 family serine peptidase [Phycisphaerae bacterium]MCZ2399777.1 S8 family serine peptidase [Phycisphaerae bacterium]
MRHALTIALAVGSAACALADPPRVPPFGARPDTTWSMEQRAAAFAALREEAGREGLVRVIVEFAVPELEALTQASVAAQHIRASDEEDATLAEAIAGGAEGVLGLLTGTRHELLRVYRTVPAAALLVSGEALEVLESWPDVLSISRDASLQLLVNSSVPAIRAPQAWQLGFLGYGSYVAVLDSGILTEHRMFTNTHVVQACFATGFGCQPLECGDCPNGLGVDTTSPDAAAPYPSSFFGFDHGTFVSGIAVGLDSPGQRYGVAPDANLIAIKVFRRVDGQFCNPPPGFSGCLDASASDVLAAMEFVYSLRNTYRIAALNLSLGFNMQADQQACDNQTPPMTQMVTNLFMARIFVVAASGNDGSCTGMRWPSCISTALAIGATNDSRVEPNFSNGHCDMVDLYAPGVSITSASAAGPTSYATYDGTSAAAPHVAGALAILRQAEPTASALELYVALASPFNSLPAIRRCCPSELYKAFIQVDKAALSVIVSPWVDFAHDGPENGSFQLPYDTLAEGLNAATRQLVTIKAGSTSATATISQPVTLRSFGGLVRIGQ